MRRMHFKDMTWIYTYIFPLFLLAAASLIRSLGILLAAGRLPAPGSASTSTSDASHCFASLDGRADSSRIPACILLALLHALFTSL
jgi:hypothetical protein